jgi:hypothetical protein
MFLLWEVVPARLGAAGAASFRFFDIHDKAAIRISLHGRHHLLNASFSSGEEKKRKAGRLNIIVRYFGSPAVSERSWRLSAPPSRMVEYYRVSCEASAGNKKAGRLNIIVRYFGSPAVSNEILEAFRPTLADG